MNMNKEERMLNVLKSFIADEDGGADQLIIAAILVVAGIAVAVFFGEEIGKLVKGLMDKMSSGADGIEQQNFDPNN